MACCAKTIRVTSVDLVGTMLNLTITPMSFRNVDCYTLVIGTPIPMFPAGINPQVQIINGLTTLPVLDRAGNNVRGLDLFSSTRHCQGLIRSYPAVYGNDTPHVSILAGLRGTFGCVCGDGFSTTSVIPTEEEFVSDFPSYSK